MTNEKDIMNEGCAPMNGGALHNRVLFTPELLDSYSHMRTDAPPPKSFRVGVLTTNLKAVGKTVYSIANPASPCVVSAVATLDPVDPDTVRKWAQSNNIGPEYEEIVVESGDEGFREIIAGSDVDAVYLSLPLEYVLEERAILSTSIFRVLNTA